MSKFIGTIFVLILFVSLCGCPKSTADRGPREVAAIPLPGDAACHLQGITVAGQWLFATCVDRGAKKGWLYRYRLPEGFPRSSSAFAAPEKIDVTRGEMYHPSGVTHDAECVWFALAHYRKDNASARVSCIDPESLEEKIHFEVADHVGAVALLDDRLALFNWDSRDIYIYSREGQLISRNPSPSQTAFQDCAGGPDASAFSCSGPARDGLMSGARVETMEPSGGGEGEIVVTSSEFISRPGVILGREGFERMGGYMIFAPKDFPGAELFVFASE